MNTLKCIIVDDEPFARKGMEEYVNEIDFLQLVGIAENPVKAASLINDHKPHLMFLDIQMPKITGIDFLKTLKDPPMVIFTTAYPQYALEGYALDVLDYLVKPIEFNRFLKSCSKAKEYYEMKHKTEGKPASENYFFIKCENKFEKIFYDDLLFAEAMQNYVILHTKERRFVTYITFKGIEENLPKDKFIRIHKSFIVSLSKIESIDGNDIKIGTHSLPISRNLKDEVMEKILGNNLVKR